MCCKCKATLATNRVDDNNIWSGIGFSSLSLHTCGFLIFYFLSSHTHTHTPSFFYCCPFFKWEATWLHTYIHTYSTLIHAYWSLSLRRLVHEEGQMSDVIHFQTIEYIHPSSSSSNSPLVACQWHLI